MNFLKYSYHQHAVTRVFNQKKTAFNQKQLASIKAEKNAFVNKDYQTYWEKKIEQVGNISEDFKE